MRDAAGPAATEMEVLPGACVQLNLGRAPSREQIPTLLSLASSVACVAACLPGLVKLSQLRLFLVLVAVFRLASD